MKASTSVGANTDFLNVVTAIQPVPASDEQALRDWWVMLWSQSQNAFHVEPLKHMMNSNRRAYADDRRMDYVPLYVGTRDTCFDLADMARSTLRSRESMRGAARDVIEAAMGIKPPTGEGAPR